MLPPLLCLKEVFPSFLLSRLILSICKKFQAAYQTSGSPVPRISAPWGTVRHQGYCWPSSMPRPQTLDVPQLRVLLRVPEWAEKQTGWDAIYSTIQPITYSTLGIQMWARQTWPLASWSSALWKDVDKSTRGYNSVWSVLFKSWGYCRVTNKGQPA